MIARLGLLVCIATLGLPAMAQTYDGTLAEARHGNGYEPGAIVAGWETDTAFTVLAFAPDGQRKAGSALGLDWKVIVTTGPRAPKDNEEEDERYLAPNVEPKAHKGSDKPVAPPQPRRVVTYSSQSCPAVLERMSALKPLMSFTFDPPAMKGEKDGPNGDGREGYDLFVRAGDAELNKSAETAQSGLGGWMRESVAALKACPTVPNRK